jgi:hypothetical protein
MKPVVKIMIVLCCCIATQMLKAQSYNLDTIKASLYKVNKVFDSSRYMGFDVNLIYDTDTLFGKFEHDEVFANYVINNKNIYYKMGDVEYVQTDSFVYNIAASEKMLMMTKDPLASNGSLFPLKEFVDSTIKNYQSYYTISITTDGVEKVINFAGNSPDLPYTNFSIRFDSTSFYPRRLEMTMLGEFDLSEVPDSLKTRVKLKPMHRRVTMDFVKYYSVNDLSVFQDNNYVVYDLTKRLYRPVAKYKGYQFMTNGIEGENTDPDTEQTPETSNE